MRHIKKINILLSGILLLYLFIGFYTKKYGVPIKWLYWNLFLAIIPFYLALIALLLSKIKYLKYIIVPILLLRWLLFLPNSFYLLTDLIHLDASHLVIDTSIGLYSSDLSQWVRMLYIATGILIGVFLGLYSTYIIHLIIVPEKSHRFWTGCYLTIISSLVGYGVYIGRFLRLNTWDILHPRSLFQTLIINFDKFTIKFSFIIAFIFFISYLVISFMLENSLFKASKKSS